MKLKSLTILFIVTCFCLENIYGAETISISSPTTTDVCNAKQYVYSATTSGLDPNKSYYANWIVNPGTYTEGTISGVKVTWGATTTSNIGTLKVELKNSNNVVVATSNEISFTIKSIKHIKAQLPLFGGGGGVFTIDPCQPGTLYLGAADIAVPGTGNPPQEVFNWKWLVPSGWTVDGQTSNGTTMILGNQDVTITYPASSTEGTIKVSGYHVVNGCTSELQESLPSDAVTVSRKKTLTLSASKSVLLCLDTSPVTFTITPALPCAVYYWNNSQTPSTNNSFQVIPDGSTNVTVTVNVVYSGTPVTLSKTINYQLFPPDVVPAITGSGFLCGNNESYSISNLRSGYTVSWNCSSNLTRVSPQISYPGIFNYNTTGSGWIEATISTPCGNWPNVLHIPVWAGLTASFSGNTSVLVGGSGTWTGSATCGTPPYNYEWYLREDDGSGTEGVLVGTDNSLTLWSVPRSSKSAGVSPASVPIIMQPITKTIYYLYLRVSDANNRVFITPEKQIVGYGNVDLINPLERMELGKDENISTLQLKISPNPASNETTIEINDTGMQDSKSNSEWQVEVYDAMQSLKVKAQKLKGNQYNIHTAGWKEGIYMVRVKFGEEIITGKLVVKP